MQVCREQVQHSYPMTSRMCNYMYLELVQSGKERNLAPVVQRADNYIYLPHGSVPFVLLGDYIKYSPQIKLSEKLVAAFDCNREVRG